MEPFTFTRHAITRMEQMNLTTVDILHAIEHAEVSWIQENHNERGPQTVCKYGDITVAYSHEERCVITVLYNTQDQYVRPDAEVQVVPDRSERRVPPPPGWDSCSKGR